MHGFISTPPVRLHDVVLSLAQFLLPTLNVFLFIYLLRLTCYVIQVTAHLINELFFLLVIRLSFVLIFCYLSNTALDSGQSTLSIKDAFRFPEISLLRWSHEIPLAFYIILCTKERIALHETQIPFALVKSYLVWVLDLKQRCAALCQPA
jgi:hypothetical protein